LPRIPTVDPTQAGVDSNTIQGWESGRRSLTATHVATLVQLQHRPRQHGAGPKLLALVVDAAEADHVLSYALTAEPNAIQPAAPLLTNWVLKGSLLRRLIQGDKAASGQLD
jgi:hypothetical protein